jgi:hypothetical protein
MENKIVIPYRPRGPQVEIHKRLDKARFSVCVLHRRAGKTVMAVNQIIKRACQCSLRLPRYAYVAPFLKQAKLIAWDYFKYYTSPIPGIRVNESELFVELPNGARIYLWGSDNPDALRGTYLDGVVMDEYAQFRPGVWEEIIRPALTDRNGWAMWIGTPKGQNPFYETFLLAQRQAADGNNDWFSCLYRADETDIIPEGELEQLRTTLPESVYRQEMLCDWSAAADNVLIPIDLVSESAKREVLARDIAGAVRILGVDCARFGDDRSCIILREGIYAHPPIVYKQIDLMQLVGHIVEQIERHDPDATFVDEGGLGAGVVDRLKQLGYKVVGVNFGAKAINDTRYANKRAEMWDACREWLEGGGVIPNEPAIKSDLISPTYSYDPSNRIKLESKDDMKKRGLPSPDVADALVLTWAFPVRGRAARRVPAQKPKPYNPFRR